ncbi:hypothetical protein B0H17DRAFT_1326207 [Mycena rosella]|uniref:Uncharacterized protein n=1 Tax=Mycena rosella TaxID=1033263 RepID=A0AAD7GU62_MYCRO|nr:hypothetical protein B0H17DRAFT_1326207 [Mycena rosella]
MPNTGTTTIGIVVPRKCGSYAPRNPGNADTPNSANRNGCEPYNPSVRIVSQDANMAMMYMFGPNAGTAMFNGAEINIHFVDSDQPETEGLSL